MKINHIIREKRKELSLTQEQVAEFLGVSTPAVNKWEKGGSYPDITLLPALARLLKTDLDRYAGYIRYFSKMNGYYNSDMEDYIRTKLIESLFKFRLDR